MRIGWVLIALVGCRIVDVGCPTTTDIPHPTSRIRPRPRKFREPGFTLVELLVVVAIIALLIAILLPGLKKAKAAAVGAVCMSNMHQVGSAMYMYAGDYNGYALSPESSYSPDHGTTYIFTRRDRNWPDTLMSGKYLADVRVFVNTYVNPAAGPGPPGSVMSAVPEKNAFSCPSLPPPHVPYQTSGTWLPIKGTYGSSGFCYGIRQVKSDTDFRYEGEVYSSQYRLPKLDSLSRKGPSWPIHGLKIFHGVIQHKMHSSFLTTPTGAMARSATLIAGTMMPLASGSPTTASG